MPPKRIDVYRTRSGWEPFTDFVQSLHDHRAENKIEARIYRARSGNLGDHWSVGGGVIELRIHYGPGYRIYVGLQGQELIVLLCGGNKASQPDDIRRAIGYWHDHRGRR